MMRLFNSWLNIRRSIATQFIVYIIFFSVIPLLVLGGFAYSVSFSIVQKQVASSTAELVNAQKDYLDLHLQEIESLMANLSGVEDITDAIFNQDLTDNVYNNLATQARIGYILNNYINLKGLISIDIFTMRGTHYHVGDTLQFDNVNEQAKEIILNDAQKMSGGIVWTGIEDNINVDSKHKKVITAAKVFTEFNAQSTKVTPVGLLVVNYSPEYLFDHYSQIHLGQNAYLMIVDTQGRIIYHPDMSLLGNKVNDAFMASVTAASGSLTTRVNGKDMMVTYYRSDNSQWIVASFIPVENLTAQTMPIAITTLVALTIGMAGVFFFSLRINRNLVNPITQITQTFKRYKEGNLDLSTRLSYHSGNEIGELVLWFNDFLDSQVEKRRAEEALCIRQHYLTLLNEITLAALGTMDLDAMLKNLCQQMEELFQADNSYILLMQLPEQKIGTSVYGGEGRLPEHVSETKLDQHLSDLIHIKEPVFIADVSNNSLVKPWIAEMLHARSMLVLPLRSDDRILGLAFVISHSHRIFSVEEISTGAQAAHQISLALTKTFLLEDIQKRASVFENLYETASDLANLSTIPELLKSILSHSISLVGVSSGFIFLMDEAQGDLILQESQGFPLPANTRLNIGEGLAGQVALERKPILVEDYSSWEYRSEKFDQLSLKGAVAVPMIWGSDLIGVLGVECDSNQPRVFKESAIQVLSLIARLGTSGINNIILLEELRMFTEQLEERVANRTALLEKANLDLAAEINERKQIEETLKKERASLAQRVADRTVELSEVNIHLAQAVRAKDEFLANMSHELRTPLNAILGMSEAMIEEVYGPLNERQTRFMHTIEESGRHLLSLINDILDLSKIEAGKIDLEQSQFPVEALCVASFQFVRQIALKKRINISMNLNQAPETMRADERRMKQILVNLLSNAMKFTPEGGSVGLDVFTDTAKRILSFSVWDTGIGIAPEDQKKLFKPFVQVDSGLARHHEGTGLGLALVARLTELQGGSVELESEVGKGSRFTVKMPLIASEEDAISLSVVEKNTAENAQVLKNDVQNNSHDGKPLILLVEDNEVNIQAVEEYLKIKGYRTLIARNGIEALEQVAQNNPDLILMDIQMPGMDGLEATRRIRKDLGLVDIPIIALTALAMPGDQERCVEAGANAYLSKPVGLKMLVEMIQQLLIAKSP